MYIQNSIVSSSFYPASAALPRQTGFQRLSVYINGAFILSRPNLLLKLLFLVRKIPTTQHSMRQLSIFRAFDQIESCLLLGRDEAQHFDEALRALIEGLGLEKRLFFHGRDVERKAA